MRYATCTHKATGAKRLFQIHNGKLNFDVWHIWAWPVDTEHCQNYSYHNFEFDCRVEITPVSRDYAYWTYHGTDYRNA